LPPLDSVSNFSLSHWCGSALASLSEGGGFAEGEDGGSAYRWKGHSPSQKSKIFASPLKEGAKGSFAAELPDKYQLDEFHTQSKASDQSRVVLRAANRNIRDCRWQPHSKLIAAKFQFVFSIISISQERMVFHRNFGWGNPKEILTFLPLYVIMYRLKYKKQEDVHHDSIQNP